MDPLGRGQTGSLKLKVCLRRHNRGERRGVEPGAEGRREWLSAGNMFSVGCRHLGRRKYNLLEQNGDTEKLMTRRQSRRMKTARCRAKMEPSCFPADPQVRFPALWVVCVRNEVARWPS